MLLTNQEAKTILTKVKNLSSVKLYLYIRGYEEKVTNYSTTYGELHKSLKISQTQLTTCLKELVELGLLVKDGREYKSTHSYIVSETSAELPDVVLQKLSVEELFEIECEEDSPYQDRIIKTIVGKCQEAEAELMKKLVEIAHRYAGISLYGAHVLYSAMQKSSGVTEEDFFTMLDIQVKMGKEPAKLHWEYEDNMFDEIELKIIKDRTNGYIEYANAEMAKLQIEADERGMTLEELVKEKDAK